MITALSPNHGPNLNNPVWCVIHTAQGATTDESLAAFLDNPASQVSYHYICDDDSETQIVTEDQQSWSALGANRYGIHLCCTGFVAWTRDEWLAHPAMLGFLADRIGEIATRRGYPVVHLGDQAIRDHAAGVLGHGDYARATGDGDHADPGPNFPWDVVLARAAGATTGGDSMSAADVAQIMARLDQQDARTNQVVQFIADNFNGAAAKADNDRNLLAGFTRDTINAAVRSIPAPAASATTEAAPTAAAVVNEMAARLTPKAGA